jgi:hypothetical protein
VLACIVSGALCLSWIFLSVGVCEACLATAF